MNNGVLVIGGGAAGMMAAVCAARMGAAVTLLEPNERLGKKLNITGKGRCNVTNDSPRDELIAHVPQNGRFLYSAFSRWDGRDTMAIFESLGVPLKVERGRRVFPVSDRSFDISAALERELRRLRVRLVRDRALSLLTEGSRVTGAAGERGDYPADAVIVATGGVSYPATGSTGDGYRLAREAGHTVIEPRPSLVPVVCADACCAAMQGLSLKNVTLRVFDDRGKTVFSELGEILFTHFGVSGPLVLSASAHMRDWGKRSYRMEIDLKSALDEQKLDARLLRDLRERSNQDMSNVLGGLLPRGMIPAVLEKSGVPGETKANGLSREQRRALLVTLKHFSLTPTGLRPVEEAIITSGGVKTGELDPHTMASKKLSGLFFAGEVIDVDAYTGGFNLQIAWATGKAAGEGAAQYLQSLSSETTLHTTGAKTMKEHYSVAVDGPSGAGKSTLAKEVAGELGITYVDTGAIYRTIGYALMERGVDASDEAAVAAVLPELTVGMRHGADGVQHMLLNGEDVSAQIRLPEVSMLASAASALPCVRAYLLEMQRRFAREQSVIMDGRDIGTVVLPDADVKIYLTADAEVRAKRRWLELEQRGTPKPFEDVLSELIERDYNDSHRAIAPLTCAPDAVVVDTTELDFAQSRQALLDTIRERLST